jgi:hypothetical protein
MADRHDDLIRVLPDAVAIQLTYWLVTRAETLRRPEVACTNSATCSSACVSDAGADGGSSPTRVVDGRALIDPG